MVRKNKWWMYKLPFSMSTSMLWSERNTWSGLLATTIGWQPTHPSSQPTSLVLTSRGVEIFPTQDPLSPRCTSQLVATWYTWLNLPPQPTPSSSREGGGSSSLSRERARIFFFFVWSRMMIFFVVGTDVLATEEIKLIFRYLYIRNLPLYILMTMMVVSTGLASFLSLI